MRNLLSMSKTNQLSIGEVARRTGLSVSAIRFYEERGLVASVRNSGGQRRFARSDIRRLSFVMIAQQMGFSIDRIGKALSSLPLHKAPTKSQWSKIAENFQSDLQDRIATLSRMSEKLGGCIGCGCLSLDQCHLYNPQDRANGLGSGPRFLMSDDRVVKGRTKTRS